MRRQALLALWACVAVLLAPALSWAQVPAGMGTQPGGLDGGSPVGSAWTRCRSCHDRELDLSLPLYFPFDSWASSMMANAARDPLFRAALAVANQDVPGVGSWCLRCHSPQAWVQGHTTPPDGSGFDALDLEGVTCDACHRSVVPAGVPGAPFVFNAQLYWEPGPLKYGPYPNVSSPAHLGAPSAFTGSSELCGQCHQVLNPLMPWRDVDGGLLGPMFPLDTTYEEWAQSDFARGPDAGRQGCTGCHLPRFKGDGGSFPVGKFGPLRPAPRRHALVGGNLWGLEAVQRSNPDLAELSEQFEETKRLTRESLRAAAALSLDAPSVPVSGDAVEVRVRVQNLTGHKLPTGYGDGRRVVLQLLVDGVAQVGAFDGGTLLEDGQARVYEAVHGRLGLGPEEHLALHDLVVKDSRLPPRGLRSTPLTRPVGVDWFDLPDGGLSDTDLATFRLALPAAKGDGEAVRVVARLLYQPTTPGYVHFLAAQNRTDDAGTALLELWKATGEAAPEEMAKAEATVTLSRPADGGQGGGGGTKPCGCAAAPVGPLGLLALWALLKRRSR